MRDGLSPGAWDRACRGATLRARRKAQAFAETFLIDNDGQKVHSWTYSPGTAGGSYLLSNGDYIRGYNTGDPWFLIPGQGGGIMRQDWDGNVLWDYTYSDSTHRHHHDIEVLPNGNVLAIAWERRDATESIAAGRDPALLPDGELFPDTVIEFQPVGTDSAVIVWEWRVWDHLVQDVDSTKANFGVVADHPELVNLNFTDHGPGGRDWNHMNAVDYNEFLDQVVVSVNIFSEFWIIDHSTTTAEAAGHTGGNRGKGGDILYRWGNPETYGRGTASDRYDYRNHNVQWIDPGLPGATHILYYNNGNGRPAGAFSSPEELITPVDAQGDYPALAPGVPHGPALPTWTYTATPPESLYSPFTSGVQRLPDGHTLICEGREGVFWEIDTADQVVWKYVCPVNSSGPMKQNTIPTGNGCFRATRLATSYPAFAGRDVSPKGVIELLPTDVAVTLDPDRFVLRQNRPNPFRAGTTIRFSLLRAGPVKMDVYDVGGRHVTTLIDEHLVVGDHDAFWGAERVPSGIYQVRLQVDGRTATRKMTLLR